MLHVRSVACQREPRNPARIRQPRLQVPRLQSRPEHLHARPAATAARTGAGDPRRQRVPQLRVPVRDVPGRVREVAAAVPQEQEGKGDMKHGVAATYRNEGCRCELCRKANSARCTRWRVQADGREPPKHGRAGYSNYGCRCEVCTEANKAAMKAYHAARKAEAPA